MLGGRGRTHCEARDSSSAERALRSRRSAVRATGTRRSRIITREPQIFGDLSHFNALWLGPSGLLSARHLSLTPPFMEAYARVGRNQTRSRVSRTLPLA